MKTFSNFHMGCFVCESNRARIASKSFAMSYCNAAEAFTLITVLSCTDKHMALVQKHLTIFVKIMYKHHKHTCVLIYYFHWSDWFNREAITVCCIMMVSTSSCEDCLTGLTIRTP